MSKYPCGLIEDIIPLYIEGDVSSDTMQIVEEHLKECNSCTLLHREYCNDEVKLDGFKEDFPQASTFKRWMKRLKIWALIAAVSVFLLLYGLFSIIVNSVIKEGEEHNRIVQSWLVNNIQNADSFMLSLSLDTSYAQRDKVRPEGIPGSLYTDYQVYIIKSERKAKIVSLEPIKNEKGLIRWAEKTIYLSIEGDKVIIYKGTDNGFEKKSYEDAKLAEAVSKILFPKDISVYNNFTIDYQSFDETKMSASMYFVKEYWKEIYYLLNGSQYENIYSKNNREYNQSLSINCSQINEVENFELPKVE